MGRRKRTPMEVEAAELKKKESRSRHIKENYPIIKDGFFNVKDRAPFGYNYLLGFCEQANNFATGI